MMPVIRKVDEIGRIVLPIEYRQALQLSEGSEAVLTLYQNRAIVEKYSPACVLCGGEEALSDIDGHTLCQSCMKKIAAANAAK